MEVDDYKTNICKEVSKGKLSPISLQKSNVLKYFLEDGSWFCVRPSGTEPKCKFYFSVVGQSLKDSEEKVNRLQTARSEEHTSELQSRENLVCRLLLEKKKENTIHRLL